MHKGSCINYVSICLELDWMRCSIYEAEKKQYRVGRRQSLIVPDLGIICMLPQRYVNATITYCDRYHIYA